MSGDNGEAGLAAAKGLSGLAAAGASVGGVAGLAAAGAGGGEATDPIIIIIIILSNNTQNYLLSIHTLYKFFLELDARTKRLPADSNYLLSALLKLCGYSDHNPS